MSELKKTRSKKNWNVGDLVLPIKKIHGKL